MNETARQHEPGQSVADFNISVPQNVDVCSLHVRIRAGNSAGMSSPSEAVEVGKLHVTNNLKNELQGNQNPFVFYTLVCSGDNTESTATGSNRVTVSPTTTSTDNRRQGDNTILIGELSVTEVS